MYNLYYRRRIFLIIMMWLSMRSISYRFGFCLVLSWNYCSIILIILVLLFFFHTVLLSNLAVLFSYGCTIRTAQSMEEAFKLMNLILLRIGGWRIICQCTMGMEGLDGLEAIAMFAIHCLQPRSRIPSWRDWGWKVSK